MKDPYGAFLEDNADFHSKYEDSPSVELPLCFRRCDRGRLGPTLCDLPHLIHPLEPRAESESVLLRKSISAEAATFNQPEEMEHDTVEIAVVLLAAQDHAERLLQEVEQLLGNVAVAAAVTGSSRLLLLLDQFGP